MDKIVLFFEFIGSINIFLLSLAIVLESIVPIVPVSVLMSISVAKYGFGIGFIVSYFSTVLGCLLSYALTRYIFKHYIIRHLKKRNNGFILIEKIGAMSLGNVVILMSFPFAPAFLFNILSGLATMRIKKFVAAILISKLALVYFWCYVGKTLSESLGDPKIILKIILIVLVSYVVSKIVDKKFGIS